MGNTFSQRRWCPGPGEVLPCASQDRDFSKTTSGTTTPLPNWPSGLASQERPPNTRLEPTRLKQANHPQINNEYVDSETAGILQGIFRDGSFPKLLHL